MQITLGNINLNMRFIRTNAMPFFKRLAIFLISTVNHMPAGDTDKNCMRGEHDDQFDWENTQN